MGKIFRLFIVIAVVSASLWFLFPTIRWYFLTDKPNKEDINQPLNLIGEIARLNSNKDVAELIQLANENQNQDLPENLNYFTKLAKSLSSTKIPKDHRWSVLDILRNTSDREEVKQFSENHYSQPLINAKNEKNRALKLGLDLSGGLGVKLHADFTKLERQLGRLPSEQEKIELLDASLLVLSTRANQFGTTEPSIRRLGSNSISIDLPGEKDPDAINRLIIGRGNLAFHIVDKDLTKNFEEHYAKNPQIEINKDGSISSLRDIIPAGYIVRGEYSKDSFGMDRFLRYYVLREQVGMEGIHINNVGTNYSETNEPLVIFSLDTEGSSIFGKLTTANVGESLSVLMDNKIKSIANIREPITNGRVSVSGFSIIEAKNLATVLRTANLPLEFDIVKLQKIGPSLGHKAIKSGILAMCLGLTAVYLFTAIYYTGAGILACITLSINLIFIMGILSFLGFTLTLTSIAGLILNIGMSVDANVIIFERIREEKRAGKARAQAIEAGFRKAFWTIMDSNLTTFIATLFLSVLGTGPVKGFAITLSVGIVSTLFTSVYVSRVLFDIGTEVFHRKTLWIGYGVTKS